MSIARGANPWYSGPCARPSSISSPRPEAGGAIFVPERDPADKKDWLATAAALAQIIASLATTVLVVNNIK